LIVVDASALLECVVGDRPDPALIVRLASEELHAPHLIDVEVLHALRLLITRRVVTEKRAATARGDFLALEITRYPHLPLADRIWDLRHNLSAYDATYVALAEALDASFVTTDSRIAGAPNLRTVIEVFGDGS
jgi:predicted nucleic acid-binding protein